ncbi:hypothetical protein Tco_0204400 [Tanacetum coccineum]
MPSFEVKPLKAQELPDYIIRLQRLIYVSITLSEAVSSPSIGTASVIAVPNTLVKFKTAATENNTRLERCMLPSRHGFTYPFLLQRFQLMNDICYEKNLTLYGLPDTVNLLKDTRADLVHSAAIIQDKNMLVRSSPNLEKLRVQHDRRLDYITRKYISTASIYNESARRKAQEQDE